MRTRALHIISAASHTFLRTRSWIVCTSLLPQSVPETWQEKREHRPGNRDNKAISVLLWEPSPSPGPTHTMREVSKLHIMSGVLCTSRTRRWGTEQVSIPAVHKSQRLARPVACPRHGWRTSAGLLCRWEDVGQAALAVVWRPATESLNRTGTRSPHSTSQTHQQMKSTHFNLTLISKYTNSTNRKSFIPFDLIYWSSI